ncbi:MAG: type IX secretion system membrane protein PorP/SprF [Sphingomonadales bacterium]|nr:type IX secretion system membrane protein PorP/SprF [Sphingomonadales bacterium]
MRHLRKHIGLFCGVFLFAATSGLAQDPHYTQFFATPYLINPAYTGVFDGDLRLSTNYRQQWMGLASPITSMVASVDGKLFNDGVYHQNPFNVGLAFQSDKTLNGALSSNGLTANASYHIPLDREGYQSLGIGLSGTYGKRNFNFSNMASASQFTSGGFNLALPSGEIAMENMKPHFSVGAGVLYCNSKPEEGSFFEIGVGAYHLNRPLQTILYEGTSVIPMRVSAHTFLQRYVGSDLLLDGRLLYQLQAGSDYLLGGIALSKLLEEDPQGSLIGLGCWYRTGDAIAPYLFGEFNSLRIGFTYDIQLNDIRKPTAPVTTIEFSLQYRLRSK